MLQDRRSHYNLIMATDMVSIPITLEQLITASCATVATRRTGRGCQSLDSSGFTLPILEAFKASYQ
ncbi:hypothetical protein [Nostoc sp.]|uniref:hypothetical protein n=1 Tax=Nostoc sp. TaxID=1180 RepID=UPI002FFD5048